MARHKAAQSTSRGVTPAVKWGALAIGLIVLVVGGIFASGKAKTLFGGCSDTANYSVAADASIAPVVKKVIESRSEKDLGCSTFTVTAAESTATVSAVATGRNAPSIWIPDSSYWLQRAGQSTGAIVDTPSASVAATPVTIVGRQGDVPAFDSWLELLTAQGVRMGNPLTDGVSLAPLTAALAEASTPDQVEAALVPLAQSQGSRSGDENVDARLAAVAKDGGVAIASEQQMISYQQRNPDVKLAGEVPATGAVVMNYPIAATEPAGPKHGDAVEAAKRLADAFASDEGKAALSEAGFRQPDMAPLDQNRGVGQVQTLTVADQSKVNTAVKNFAKLALPIRTLAVADVSGSMNIQAGSQTRMQLMISAGGNGLTLFNDNAALGLWAFSTNLDGPGKDYRELVPIRKMGEASEGISQRQQIAQSVLSLPALIGGATGLYDTVLAAWRKVKESYDPGAINSVILLTDGANEDPGSISLDELLATFQREQDPARPVQVVTIGITKDADAPVLQKISAATQSSSFIAENPADIPGVFVKALRARENG